MRKVSSNTFWSSINQSAVTARMDDEEHDCYVCPNGKVLPRSRRKCRSRADDMISYFSRFADYRMCPLKSRCCPKMPTRKITRHIHEAAHDLDCGPLAASPTAFVHSRVRALAALLVLQDLFGAFKLPHALLEVLLFIQSIQFDGSEVIARYHALDPVVLDYR
jgi:hypothetical protein